MVQTLTPIRRKNFAVPDESRPFADRGHIRILDFSGQTVGLATFEPGWRWSTHVKPIAGTDSCQAPHFSYVVAGRMAIQAADGTKVEVGPGDMVQVDPGHDAWVIGDEPCVQIDFQGALNYAKR